MSIETFYGCDVISNIQLTFAQILTKNKIINDFVNAVRLGDTKNENLNKIDERKSIN